MESQKKSTLANWEDRYDLFSGLGAGTYIFKDTCKKAEYSYEKMSDYDDEARLAHKVHGYTPCTRIGPEDTFDCYYIFGETILHTTHGFGECPYLKGGTS